MKNNQERVAPLYRRKEIMESNEFVPELRFIQAIPGGYLVRKTVQREYRRQYFSAARYGGHDQALTAAITTRNEWVALGSGAIRQ